MNLTHNIIQNSSNTRCTWMNEQKKDADPLKLFTLHTVRLRDVYFQLPTHKHALQSHILSFVRTHNTFGSWLYDVIRVAAAKWIGRIIYFIQFIRNVNVYRNRRHGNKFSLIVKIDRVEPVLTTHPHQMFQ